MTVLLSLLSLYAQDEKEERPKPRETFLRLGVFGLTAPDYPGSNDYETRALPFFDLQVENRVFINPRRGLGYYLKKDKSWNLGAALGYNNGRDEDENGALYGLGDIDSGLDLRVFATKKFGLFSLNWAGSHQLTGDDTGFLQRFSAGFFLPQRGWRLRTSIGIDYASNDYMDAWFGIDADQAFRSAYQIYNPDRGFNSVNAGIMLLYDLTENLTLQSGIRQSRLINDASDSPIVQDRDQTAVTLGLSWTFD